MYDDMHNKGNSLKSELNINHAQDCSSRASGLDAIIQIDSSLEAIRCRIDEAYNHICLDLPDINMEIYRTFQQASDTLDSLIANGSPGTISHVVEGLEITLQNIMIRLKHLKNHDERFHDTIRLACQDVQADPSEGEISQGFLAVRDELLAHVSCIQEKENELIEEISTHISDDIRSLEFTLSSTVDILKDLISRSNAVKNPILKIMSGLQTHDIVNQDISTISLGLRKMYSLRNLSRDSLAEHAVLFFQGKASSQSRTLMTQLIEVVRNHGCELESEISRIESLIFHVKEDKDAISEFLLMNQGGMSTFDIVIAEVLHMFADITAKLDGLASMKEKQQAQSMELTELFGRLDRNAQGGASRPLTSDMPNLVLRMITPLKSQGMMLKHVSGLHELKENAWILQKDSDLVRHKLEEIKIMLIGSIRGIDAYSGRCLDAIAKFKLDIQELMKTLDGSDQLLEGLDSLAISVGEAAGHEHGGNGAALPDDLSEILYRLENPHSTSLVARENEGEDDGLCFF